MANIYLLTSESDPVGNAVESLFEKSSPLQRISSIDLSDIDFGESDALILGDGVSNEFSTGDLPESGLIQFIGCRPTAELLDRAEDSDAFVVGISPSIAPRVANRVIGFTGPLKTKVMPDWGVIGLGEVGSEVTKKVTANRSLVAIAEMRTPRSGLMDELGVRRQSLDLLVAGSDVVSIHIHQGPTAAPLISERELNLMKSDAVLINTSSSTVIDEVAVVDALSRGRLAGYATDCPGEVINGADESLATTGKLIITTNPLTNQIGAAQQIAKYVEANVTAFSNGSRVQGKFDVIGFPSLGDPSFWSSQMSPRQD